MKKFYEKSEILFAIFWIVVYTVSMANVPNIEDGPYAMLVLAAISLLMFLFVWKNGLMEKYGLSGWAKNNRAMLWFIPLWLIASCNLWSGVAPKYPMPRMVFAAVSMALVGFAEELIFRGFLFKAMLKEGSVKTAVVVSSVTFGLGHILNFLIGRQGLVETLVQAAFAVAFGFVVTMVFFKSGSLLPCILTHSLTDVFSVFAPEDAPSMLNWIAHAVVFITALAYCLYLLKRVETPPINRLDRQKENPPCPRQ